MSEQVLVASRTNRVTQLTVEAFVCEYLQKNQPVIITGAMHDWKALEQWEPAHLAERFGDEQVQVYGDLFRLANITTLSHYLDRYFGRNGEPISAKGGSSVPYVRWYCHLSGEERVPWADDAFARLSGDWARPAFFPNNSFALPFCPASESIDPSRDWFPARGLFISARGARTRLHADPWCSDALLCQIYGKKDFVMYHRSQAPYLVSNGRSVDIEAPDLDVFPNFPQAQVAVRDTLEPGEILLVPAGWYHHFKSTTDSISLTWNFVHLSRLGEFLDYLGRGLEESEVKQLAYAYLESPGHRPINSDGFVGSFMKWREFLTAR